MFSFQLITASSHPSSQAEKMKLKEEMRREKEAAKLKAANERAAARRIAKESIELIEDERLELMELAASRKGLPSVLALDNEALQNLESFAGGYSILHFIYDTFGLLRVINYIMNEL